MWMQLAALLVIAGAETGVMDSIVASVDRTAIKQSDVLRELKLTALLNHEPPNLGPIAKKEAVDRLVEQAMIRQEIEAGMYVPEDPEGAAALLKQVEGFYGGPAGLKKKLAEFEISEATLQKHLAWQMSVLRFVQLRFGGGAQGAPSDAVNEAFFAWLDQTRRDKRIQIREERLK